MNFAIIATGLEQIAPLILFLFIFLALKGIQRAHRDHENHNNVPNDPHKSENESRRKLMEALGLPEDALPPPVVISKNYSQETRPLPLPSLISELPPSDSPALSVADKISRPTILKEVPLVVPDNIQQLTKKRLQKSNVLMKPQEWDRSFPGLQASLRDQHAIRHAIVLREILGPPKSLCEDR